jgi:CheY-like chemotaxis protein
MLQAPNMTVLVADDERAIANALAVVVAKAGFETRAVYSGEAAVELAERFRPNMLITDVVMPGISGIETAAKIGAMLPACEILLFSGQAATVDLRDGQPRSRRPVPPRQH